MPPTLCCGRGGKILQSVLAPLGSPVVISPRRRLSWVGEGVQPLGSLGYSPCSAHPTLHSHALLSVPCTDSCSFALHARGGELTRFTTPGFPNSPYPARARCQWTLRGDADLVLSLTFRSFDVASCDERGSDMVMVYNTLSPVEPHALVR